MAECTDLERAFLDAVASGKGANIAELRDEMAVARVTHEMRELFINGVALRNRGHAMIERATKAMSELGCNWKSRPSDKLWNELEEAGRRRAEDKQDGK